jgi:hypothetical protein
VATPPPARPAGTVSGAAAAPANVEYGLLDTIGLKQAQSNLAESLQQFASKLGDVLARAVDNAASLTVSTYVTDEMAGVTYDTATRTFTGTAKLRALTRVSFDGDMLVCVPEAAGQVDQALWAIHLEMVQRAQSSRTEMVKAATVAATGLLDGLKGL